MKVDAISLYQGYTNRINSRIKEVPQDVGEEKFKSIPFVRVSFKGNPEKIPTQISAYATESNFLGGIYTSGGLGDVASLFPESVGLKAEEIIGKKIDMRTFLPYYSMDDAEGRIYVLTKDGAERRKKLKDKEKLDFARDFKRVPQDYKLQEGEQFAVITKISGDGVDKSVDMFFTLKDTGLTGTSERMAESGFNMEKVPYRLFEVETPGKADKLYLIHTYEHAKGKSAYGVYRNHAPKNVGSASAYGATSAYGASSAYGAANGVEKTFYYAGAKTDDMFFTEQLRAYQQLTIEGKMNTETFGKFNPQNHVIHDRFGYSLLTDVVQKANSGDKNFQGLAFDEFLHNPGASYQGKYANPLDYFRIIATDKDLAKLQANEHYSKVTEIAGKIENGSATKEECSKIYKFFKPYFKKLMDTEDLFNMTMIAVRMTDENPKNSSIGNVSKNYGKETRNPKTIDIAKGLTQPLIDIESKTIDVVNGSKQANMSTDVMGKFFGTGTLHELMKTKYTPYKVTDSPDKIFKAKLKNKETVINELARASKNLDKDPDALAKVFFSNDKISRLRKNATNAGDPNVKLTLGSISEFKPGDILFVSWGRPDAQKGLPITIESFEKVLKDESIPLAIRKRLKLAMGAGSGGEDMFTAGNEEWKLVNEGIERIENIEVNGKKGYFKGNIIYSNGTFPSRIVNGADLALFNSQFEPCGITPLESFAACTPVGSTNTGGAPDFIKPGKNGFLTKDPFMLNPEELGLSANATREEIYTARRNNISTQMAEQIKAYLEPLKDGTWEARQKEYIKNCAGEKIEWHNNNAYNGGKSALEIYLKEKLHVMDNDVPSEYLSDMRGEFDNSAFENVKKMEESGFKRFFASKGGKWTLGIAGFFALIAAGCALFKDKPSKPDANKDALVVSQSSAGYSDEFEDEDV